VTVGLLILEGLTLLGAGVLVYVLSRNAGLERAESARLKQATTDSHLIELRTQADAHRREVSQLIQGHRREVAVLCQRVQDPIMAAHIAELERIERLETEGIFP
jgi:replicative superfamily II helicase